MSAEESPYKGLFENEDFIILIDTLAKRYGKLPSEILCGSTIYEFNIDVAVMVSAMYAEKKNIDEARNKQSADGDKKTFSTFGIKVKKVSALPEEAK